MKKRKYGYFKLYNADGSTRSGVTGDIQYNWEYRLVSNFPFIKSCLIKYQLDGVWWVQISKIPKR